MSLTISERSVGNSCRFEVLSYASSSDLAESVSVASLLFSLDGFGANCDYLFASIMILVVSMTWDGVLGVAGLSGVVGVYPADEEPALLSSGDAMFD